VPPALAETDLQTLDQLENGCIQFFAGLLGCCNFSLSSSGSLSGRLNQSASQRSLDFWSINI